MSVNDTNLESTLRDLGVPSTVAVTIIERSEPNANDNRRVYSRVNDLLESLLAKGVDLGTTIHITGELRALSDPRHQEVCIANYQRHKSPITFVGYVPSERRTEPFLLLDRIAPVWDGADWSDTSWATTLRAFRMPARHIVSVYATDEMEEMHYSVFPDDLVLLQEKHLHEDHSKRVWLIRSAGARPILEARARRILAESTPLPAYYFQRLGSYAASTGAVDFLVQLSEHDIPIGQASTSTAWFQTLHALEYIEVRDKVSLSAAGRAYLKSLTDN